jgi:hypothetical protein
MFEAIYSTQIEEKKAQRDCFLTNETKKFSNDLQCQYKRVRAAVYIFIEQSSCLFKLIVFWFTVKLYDKIVVVQTCSIEIAMK